MARFQMIATILGVIFALNTAQAQNGAYIGKFVRYDGIEDDCCVQAYYIGADLKKHAVPVVGDPRGLEHLKPFYVDVLRSWIGNHKEDVLTISKDELLEDYAIGSNVTVRRGTYLLASQIPQTEPSYKERVFFPGEYGQLYYPSTPDRYLQEFSLQILFGDWRKHLRLLPSVHSRDYILSYMFPIDDEAVYDGTLYRFHNDERIYLVDNGHLRPFIENGFEENGFLEEQIFQRYRGKDYYPMGSPIASREERLVTPFPLNMFMRGDVNSDRGLDLSDAIRILEAIFVDGVKIACDDAADANDDGMVDITDAIAILEYLYLGADSLPYPFFIGLDQTYDEILCGAYKSNLPQLRITTAPFPLFFGVPRNAHRVWLERFHFYLMNGPVDITETTFRVHIRKTDSSEMGIDDLRNFRLFDQWGEILSGPIDPRLIREQGNDIYGTVRFNDPFTLPLGNILLIMVDVSSGARKGDTVDISIDPAHDIKTASPGIIGEEKLVQGPAREVHEDILMVSLDTVPASQIVLSGIKNFEFARIILNASESLHDIRVTQVSVVIRDKDLTPNIVQNIRLFNDSREILHDISTQRCTGATCNTLNTQSTTILTFPLGKLTVYAGTTKIISVIGDMNTSLYNVLYGNTHPMASFAMHLEEGNVKAIDWQAQSATIQTTAGKSADMFVAPAPKLTYKTETHMRNLRLAISGSSVTALHFSLEASHDDIILEALHTESRTPICEITGNTVEKIELWEVEGNQALGTVIVNTKEVKLTLNNPIVIAQGEKKNFELRVQLVHILTESQAQSGETVYLRINSLDGRGVSSAGSIYVSGLLDAYTEIFTLVKSMPYLQVLQFTGSDKIMRNAIPDLLKFSVTADNAGPIGLAKFTFPLKLTTVELLDGGFFLYISNDPRSQGQILSSGNDFSRIFQEERPGFPPLEVLEARLNVSHDDPHYYREDTADYLIIQAGKTMYFTLKGAILNHDTIQDNESVSVSISGDASFGSRLCKMPVSFQEIEQYFNDNDFIWSDTPDIDFNTPGWFNGFRVPGLEWTNTTPQTITD